VRGRRYPARAVGGAVTPVSARARLRTVKCFSTPSRSMTAMRVPSRGSFDGGLRTAGWVRHADFGHAAFVSRVRGPLTVARGPLDDWQGRTEPGGLEGRGRPRTQPGASRTAPT